jgi:hypothetical protein
VIGRRTSHRWCENFSALLVCDGSLSIHCINGDDAARHIQGAQELGDRGDFIGFLIGGNLPEHQAHLCGKGTDHVQRRSSRLARRPSARQTR